MQDAGRLGVDMEEGGAVSALLPLDVFMSASVRAIREDGRMSEQAPCAVSAELHTEQGGFAPISCELPEGHEGRHLQIACVIWRVGTAATSVDIQWGPS